MKITRLNELLENGRKLKGRWELSPKHELLYKSEGRDEEILLRGSLVGVESDALLFAFTERQSDQNAVTHIAKLGGRWSLDDKNRILFEVERESGKNDVLRFRGEWKLGDHHEILYTYNLARLKTRKKETGQLVFKGHWDISDKNRLVYSLGAGSDSAFRFRGAFQTPSILAKKGEIRYQAGVEASGRRKLKEIVLFGKWIVSNDLSLSFEMEYGDGPQAIVFGGQYRLGKLRQISLELKTREGKPLGVTLLLSRDLFDGNGQAFVRFQRFLEENRVEAGLHFAW